MRTVHLGSLPDSLREHPDSEPRASHAHTLVQWIDAGAPEPFEAPLRALAEGRWPRSFDASRRPTKGQLPGPMTLAGLPLDAWTDATRQLLRRVPTLTEIWLDEPAPSPARADRARHVLHALRALAPHVRLGLHCCGDLDALVACGPLPVDGVHADATGALAPIEGLLAWLPASAEWVPGLIATNESPHAADPVARALELHALRPFERIAPACGLGLHTAERANELLRATSALAATLLAAPASGPGPSA